MISKLHSLTSRTRNYLIIRRSENLRDDQLSCTSDSTAIIAEISVFEKNASILLMNAYSVLDRLSLASPIDKVSIYVMNRALAVAAKSEAVSHEASAVFSKIKGMFSLVGIFGIATSISDMVLTSFATHTRKVRPSQLGTCDRTSLSECLCR